MSMGLCPTRVSRARELPYKRTNNEFEFLKLQKILQIEKKNRLLDQLQKLFLEKVLKKII